MHGLDVPFVFGTFDAVEVPSGGTYAPTAADLAVMAQVQGYWTRFARTGDPMGTPAWPRHDAADTTLVIDATASTTTGIRTADCDFWQPFYDAL